MKLTFKEIVNREIDREYEVWKSGSNKVTKQKDGTIIIDSYSKISRYAYVSEFELFTLEREEVSLDEALKALEEGKEIESVASGFKYRKYGEFIDVLNSINDIIEEYSENTAWFRIDEIKGKWYIND